MNLSDNAKKIFETLYCFPGESIDDCFHRVAKEFASNEDEEKHVFQLLKENIFRPNSPVFFNAGTNHKRFSACYVSGLDDSMHGIYDVANLARKIFQYGAGIGIPIGNLREKDANIYSGDKNSVPVGRSCLTGDTLLLNNQEQEGIKFQYISIKELYDVYKTIKHPKYKIRSVVDDLNIGYNEVIDVIYNGKQEIFKITTENGYEIKATSNHRFMNEKYQWQQLKNFSKGDFIAVNGKKRVSLKCKRCGKKRLLRGHGSKYEGLCENCVVSVFYNCSIRGSQEEFEKRSISQKKAKNTDEYRKHASEINSKEKNPCWKGDYANVKTARDRARYWYPQLNDIKNCNYCNLESDNLHIHHKDGNPYNNCLDNLEVLCSSCHQKEHLKRRRIGNYRLIKCVELDKITSITFCGIDDVYDLKMKHPYHNFVANGFISHNSGPISFMKLYDAVGETTKSGGRSRRAAILMAMPIWHPNIVDFIQCKDVDGQLRNMNISVSVTDEFMQSFKDNIPFKLRTPYSGEIITEINARKLWDHLIDSSHKSADPGVLFIDTINKFNLLKKRYMIECCNPCGEEPLIPFGCCNLSSINLHSFCSKRGYNFETLYSTTYKLMKYMDHLIDIMDFPDTRFKDMAQKYRQIGIGVMGLADVLYEMDLPYDSNEGREHVSKIMKTISTACIEASADMAKEKGKFHDYEFFEKDVLEIIPNWTDNEKVLEKVRKNGLRNSLFNTAAPTGTIALSCDCSYGIEPCFGLVVTKTLSETGEKMSMVNPIFQRRFSKEPWYTTDLLEKISQNKGSLKNLRGIPKEVRDVFVVAHDIKPKDRIDMQAEIQKYISAAISSTINLPETTNRDEVSEIYRYAYSKGLKGVTIYRDGSKKSQPITFSKEKKLPQTFERPAKLQANVHVIETANGKMYTTISSYNNKPVEVFISIGKSGSLFNSFAEALGRTISIALQYGVPVDMIVKTMIGINSDRQIWTRFENTDKKPIQVYSIPDALAKLLQRYYSNIPDENRQENGEFCSRCGTYSIIMVEGCSVCTNCNESRCS